MLGTSYALTGETTLPLLDAVARVREELKVEGFGVLTEIDVQATLKEKRNGVTHVSAVDAERMLSIVENDDLAPVAEDVRARLAAVVDRVASYDHH
jgi:thiamine phosphate synthase YjbQ (UPF0047 family)